MNVDFVNAMRDARDFGSKEDLTLEQQAILSDILNRITEAARLHLEGNGKPTILKEGSMIKMIVELTVEAGSLGKARNITKKAVKKMYEEVSKEKIPVVPPTNKAGDKLWEESFFVESTKKKHIAKVSYKVWAEVEEKEKKKEQPKKT